MPPPNAPFVLQEEPPIHGLLLGDEGALREAPADILDPSDLRSFEGTIGMSIDGCFVLGIRGGLAPTYPEAAHSRR